MREFLNPTLIWPVRLTRHQLGLDLVEVTIEGIRIEGDTTRCMVALENLNDFNVRTADGNRVPLFNRPHRRSVSRPLTANIRTGRVIRDGQSVAPVFSGRLVAVQGTTLSQNYVGLRECVKIKLNLKLNVPRFLSAQSIRINRFRNLLRPVQPFALAGSRSVQTQDDEVSFGCDGNLIMGTDAIYRYAASKPATSHLIDLLNSALDEIVSALDLCCQNTNSSVVCHPTFTLSKAEWYAEFRTHDPRRNVTRFVPLLARQGRVGNVFKRRLTGQVRMFGKYSLAMQIELANGVKQTTYSKTNRRIRFEMKYGRACFRRLIGRRSNLTREQLTSALSKLQVHAARELQRIFDALSTGVQPVSEAAKRDELTLCIGHFTEHLAFAEEIQRSLRDTGRIVVENGSALRPSINALVNAQVLRFVRYAVYTVTDEFEGALLELMAEPGAAMEGQTRAIIATRGSQSEATL